MTNRKNKNQKKTKPKHGISKWFWTVFLISWGVIILLFTLISLGWLGFMPSFEELENPKTNLATEIISEDGYVLGKYYIENRSNVAYNKLPKCLEDALVATEDVRFYTHSGIDAKALFRVMMGVITGHKKGGGSTISQQLAKNLFPRNENPTVFQLVLTKFKEWVVAIKLERNYSKNEIIAMYLNTVDFGNLSHGIKSAAKTYFDKESQDLNVEESALLVGMLKAPTRYSPRRNPENALNRRNTVITQMVKYEFLDKQQGDSIKQIPIDMSRFKVQDHKVGIATYFREFLRKEITIWAKNNPKPDGSTWDIYKDGLKIYTTINYKMQVHAEDAVEEWITKNLQPLFFKHWAGYKNAPFYNINAEETERIMVRAMKNSSRYKELKKAGYTDKKIREIFETPIQMSLFSHEGEIDTLLSPWDSLRYMKSFLTCGLMAMDPSSGHVKAYVGGIDYTHFQYDHVTQAKRQVGSTFKPFVYTFAMQEGEYSPCYKVPNLPVRFDLPSGDVWIPKNASDYKEGQMVTLKEALANSLNYVSAYLMKRYGPSAIVQLVRKLGMTSDIPEVPAISLGACELTLYEMVGAINSFNNKGVYVKPIFITKICNSKGNILAKFTTEQNEAMDEVSAYKTVRLMQGVVTQGTAVRLIYRYKLDMQLAGKTGTTDNNSDGWFMGYTPQLTAGVWVGCEDRAAHFRAMSIGQGANTALPIWAIFVKKCYEDKSLYFSKNEEFAKPKEEIDIEFDCSKYVGETSVKTKYNFD